MFNYRKNLRGIIKQTENMKKIIAIAAFIMMSSAVFAQEPAQTKTEKVVEGTKETAKKVGRGIKKDARAVGKGFRKGAKKVSDGTEKAYDATRDEVKKVTSKKRREAAVQ
jgi:hypothetical protein